MVATQEAETCAGKHTHTHAHTDSDKGEDRLKSKTWTWGWQLADTGAGADWERAGQEQANWGAGLSSGVLKVSVLGCRLFLKLSQTF